MEKRVVEFIRGLRAAGVRVSLAESVDAMQAVHVLGITDKQIFRETLRATLVKGVDGYEAFDQLFPLYFGGEVPPLQNAFDELSPDDQNLLQAALQAMTGRLENLLEWLTSGDGPSTEDLERMAGQAGAQWADNQREARWVTRRTLQQMGFGRLEELLEQLFARLREMGMSEEAIGQLTGVIEANREALTEHVAQQVGLQVAQQRANLPDAVHGPDLMHKSFSSLSEDETDLLRQEVRRLVAQLRSRAALRRKRGNRGKFDAKGTIRANLRHQGVPFELRLKKKKLKPSLVLICDVSNSMWSAAEFMLRFLNELNDQVAKMRGFAFYADLTEIETQVFKMLRDNRPDDAFSAIRQSLPGGHYATSLGHSLETFYDKYLDSVNGRTTVIILGDGRNNYNTPRADLVKDLGRRAKRVIWFTPERRHQWGTGDSDMFEYEPVVDDLFIVRNLAQLSAAVDKLLI